MNFLTYVSIDCCAALFLQKLIQDASTSTTTDDGKRSAGAASSTMVIQLQHVQSAAVAAKYAFLEDELQEVQDSSAPKAGLALQKAKKRRVVALNKPTKVPSISLGGMAQERAQLQQVVDQQAVTSSGVVRGETLEVIEDEDDYD
jgi:hypothetical protein